MAVYTQVSDDSLKEFLSRYALGTALSFKGIAEGIQNSNYYLETTEGRFILTLFEKYVSEDELPYFIGLKQYLAKTGFPCPEPIIANDGNAIQALEGRKAVIISFLEGLSPKRPTVAQCKNAGASLARMHLAAKGFDGKRIDALGPQSWTDIWANHADEADAIQPGLTALVQQDIDELSQADLLNLPLPEGTIHADLFPDNAFFIGDDFTGMIDFYFACTGQLAYDLAICINAWAFEDDPLRNGDGLQYNFSKGAALIKGYQSVRPLEAAEREALPLLARGAAIRFFLTRLIDWSATPEGALVMPHNPLDYAGRLAFHRKVTSAEGYGA